MSFILPEVAVQRAITKGLRNLKDNPAPLQEIFAQYVCQEEYADIYGQDYVDGIQEFIVDTKIPVLQAFSFDAQKLPSISVHLASETEDESKAAMGDFWGFDEVSEVLTSSMTVNIDVGIHADRSKDHVLWLYYVVSYILYKEKTLLRSLGLQNITFSASDYNKDSQYMAENVWSRWMRVRCTVQNYISGESLTEVTDVEVNVEVEGQSNINL